MRQVLLLCLTLTSIVKGQTQNLNSDKKLKFGFDIGSNYSFLKIQKSGQTTVRDIAGLNGTGLRIGLVMDYTLNKLFSFTPKAELSFNDARLFILHVDGSRETKEISPLMMDFSPHFSIKLSDKKLRPYILVGPSLKIPIPDRSNPYASEYNATVVSADLGFGLDKALKYFNFSPELRYSYGLNNIANSQNLSRMYFHTVSLVFIFKG